MWLEYLKEVAHDVGDLFFPNQCLLCGRKIAQDPICSFCLPGSAPPFKTERCIRCFNIPPTLNNDGLCAQCRSVPLIFERIRFMWPYEGKAQKIIRELKYKPSLRISRFVGEILSKEIFDLLPVLDYDLIVPLPPSPQGLLKRGFSHTGVIASVLSQTAKIPASYNALFHEGYSKFQVELRPNERLRNVRNVFRADSRYVKGLKILVLDDVITTGATSTAAGLAVLNAGASAVDLLAVARSPTWLEMRVAVYNYFKLSRA